MRVAVIVEIEQLGRQRFAAGVTLALVGIDMDFQFSGHGAFPGPPTRLAPRLLAFPLALEIIAYYIRDRIVLSRQKL
jgi:hypothetical protein